MSGPRNGKFASGSPVMSAVDYEKLFRELQPKLTSCWQSLATQLGLDSDRINTIRMHHDDPEEQVFAMLCKVMKRKPKGWLGILVEGLKHHTVGRQDVVDIIEQFFRELQASLKKASGNSRRMLEKRDAIMPLQEKGTNKTPALQQRSQVKSVKRRTQNEPNETVGEHQAHSSKKRKLAANPSSKGSTGLPDGATSRPPGVHLPIVEISPKDNMGVWYLKVWRHQLLQEIPKLARNRTYFFSGKLRDESGLPIYFTYFGAFLKTCMEHLTMIEESTERRPLYMWNVTVLEQDEGYGGPARGQSEYKLKFDEHSKICWA